MIDYGLWTRNDSTLGSANDSVEVSTSYRIPRIFISIRVDHRKDVPVDLVGHSFGAWLIRLIFEKSMRQIHNGCGRDPFSGMHTAIDENRWTISRTRSDLFGHWGHGISFECRSEIKQVTVDVWQLLSIHFNVSYSDIQLCVYWKSSSSISGWPIR